MADTLEPPPPSPPAAPSPPGAPPPPWSVPQGAGASALSFGTTAQTASDAELDNLGVDFTGVKFETDDDSVGNASEAGSGASPPPFMIPFSICLDKSVQPGTKECSCDMLELEKFYLGELDDNMGRDGTRFCPEMMINEKMGRNVAAMQCMCFKEIPMPDADEFLKCYHTITVDAKGNPLPRNKRVLLRQVWDSCQSYSPKGLVEDTAEKEPTFFKETFDKIRDAIPFFNNKKEEEGEKPPPQRRSSLPDGGQLTASSEKWALVDGGVGFAAGASAVLALWALAKLRRGQRSRPAMKYVPKPNGANRHSPELSTQPMSI